MKTLTVALSKRSYPIHISRCDFVHSARVLLRLCKEDRIFIITQPRIRRLYGDVVARVLGKSIKIHWLIFPDGEKNKTLSTVEKLLTELSRHGATRNSFVLAFGGGVVGDVTGFVAAVYMRGMAFAQMPTTLLAKVDSSVGGKTGVDLKTGKNLVGAFYQPKAVFIHTDFLKSLPRREFLCGLAEVIKYGVIADAKFFDFLEHNREKILRLDEKSLLHIILRSCAIKANVVRRDEKESSLRAILNYGHTLGHAVEALTGFDRIKHGEAVAMGMAFAARLAVHLGRLHAKSLARIENLIRDYGLPTAWPELSQKKYLAAMMKDKKAGQKNIKFILPQKIGKVDIVPLTLKEIAPCL